MIVRCIVDGQVRNDLKSTDEDISELPSHMSKRSLYNRMLSKLGWKYIYDGRSRIIERIPIEGREQQQAPSWGTFRNYWAKHYPKMFVAGAREDVCNQCYVFANRHKYVAKKKTADGLTCEFIVTAAKEVVTDDEDEGGDIEEEDDDSDAEEAPEEVPTVLPPPTTNAVVANDEDQGPEEDDDDVDDEDAAMMVRQEGLVLAAARHVEMAKEQRELYQDKKHQAKQTALLPPKERVVCLVADYAQNMSIPNFAGEQPCATYYYSPLNCYVFGVVDASVDVLSAWMYTEEHAKKGGNNVASLLMHHLEHHGFLEEARTKGPFKELNFVMDNCGGQNKNRQVLRLLTYLVKKRVATCARAIFLIRGHTKNACDRLFNLMKKDYRKCNTFTPDDLVKSINNPKVLPFMVGDNVFMDWDKLENITVKKLPPGQTTKNHVFTVDINVNKGNSMACKESRDSPVEHHVIVKRNHLKKDDAYWDAQTPIAIPRVGLPDIKWIELYHKWGRFVPDDKKKQWRYYRDAPPKKVRARVAKKNKEARQQRQQRSRTDHDGDKKKPQEEATEKRKAPKEPKAKATKHKKKKDSDNSDKGAGIQTGVI
jgi:hypothetical protein